MASARRTRAAFKRSWSATFDDKKASKMFEGIDNRVNEISIKHSKFVDVLSLIVYRDVIEHFEKEQGPRGSWAPWSNSYQKNMDKRGFGGNLILQFNGRLRNAFLPSNYRKSSDGIIWFNPAKTKSGFPYAFHHDEGRSSKSGPRQFMWLSDKAMGNAAEAMLGHIMK